MLIYDILSVVPSLELTTHRVERAEEGYMVNAVTLLTMMCNHNDSSKPLTRHFSRTQWRSPLSYVRICSRQILQSLSEGGKHS